jgi:phosphatidylglycerol lysyltransferase
VQALAQIVQHFVHTSGTIETIRMNQKSSWHESLILQLITIAVIANGLVIIAATLLGQLRMHSVHAIDDTIVSLPLISGLTLVYLGSLLHRRKKAAWAVVVPLYTFILGFNLTQYLNNEHLHTPWVLMRSIVLPLVIVTALIVFRRVFTVKSAIQNFSFSARIIVAMLAVILAYGTAGYLLLDESAFHQELSVVSALHHTVDQFDFTTQQELTPYTKRATVFIDSLNILSAVAVGYIIISLFQPIRSKLSSQAHNREVALDLLQKYSRDSEDFFKIWPTDKSYFSLGPESRHHATLAYRVQRGVALVVGDPVGTTTACKALMRDFDDLCKLNDWLPAYIHVADLTLPLYEDRGFLSQKIGEEAVVNTAAFLETTTHNKYFRQIRNKFEKQGYTWELLPPPHVAAVLARVHQVSDEWLQLPGRQERGFMMGYFSEEYMQQGNLLVARDAAGTIQAFINQVPTYQADEANFDLLRHTKSALGNVNDYLLMALIESAHSQGFARLNLGLCPLAGLAKQAENKSVIDSAMRFVYANGDRFYSFSGLHRFKSKYNPTWTNRYIAYRGGVRGFSRTIYALNKAMNRTK